MADIIEIQLEIKAVKFALDSFADYGNDEEGRRNFLREHFKTKPGLKTYFGFSEAELKDVLNKLQEALNKLQEKEIKLQDEKNLLLEKDNLLLAQQQGKFQS